MRSSRSLYSLRAIRQSSFTNSSRSLRNAPVARIAPVQTLRHSSSTPNTNTNKTSTSPPPTPPNSSVDPTEVTHFNALASSWWDPHGPSRLLHLMNPLRHTFISRCLNGTPHTSKAPSALPTENKLRYLDIGCGGGIFAESAARLPTTASVTAIDPTPSVLAIAESHKRRDPTLTSPGRLTYLNTSIEHLPIPQKPQEDAYDIVSVFEVLEHVSAPGPFLEMAMKQVKPGGWLVMSTIARTWTSWLVTNVMAEDVLGIVPKGTHEWSKYVNEAELRAWFLERGWGRIGNEMRAQGVMYIPGFGWKEVSGSEEWGNYFFAVRRPVEQ
ncbi:ubiquinone biosynthesis O-methyltransferase [Periconia macrospinosa]|uniref:Ubiquinone biosynthesis O-methyltransferase, mitochondrial n=1 Tax=Periconia macrospinosa TaxID=97972 RepID=A0A2V1E4V9_9PLEO|nr:ubiquinone biosynthesis O-methyltransferase [Periconia macrospinosa]